MAEFKCNNCGAIFNKFCNTFSDAVNVECTKCGSHWTELYLHPPIKEQIIFPKPMYSDPPIFKPTKNWYIFTPSTTPGRNGW